MSFAMGNGVRWLKQQLTDVDIDLGEDEAKELLLRAVDAFVDERIVAASAFTVGHAVDKIRAPAASSLHGGSSGSGEVVLTLGGHRLVERTLLQAHEAGKQLAGVVVVDADPATDASGLAMAKRLVTAGITGVRYAPNLLAIDGELASGVTLVLLGAESILADGSMYARAGSCDVAVAASDAGVDVLALCETINFADRITLEASAGINEMHPEHKTDTDFMALFDVTPPRYLSQVAIESGCASPGELYSVVRRNT